MPEGRLSTIGFVAVCGAAALAGFFLMGGLGGGGSRSTGTKEEVIARLIGDCFDRLQRERAIWEHNTEAQIRSACNCVSQVLYVQMSDRDKEAAGSSESYALRGAMEPAIMKCIQRTGLGISE